MTRIARPARSLPQHPDIDQLKRQAKELLAAYVAGDTDASAEVHAHYRGATSGSFALHDAQLVLARAYGFDSWPKLKTYVDGVTAKAFIEAARTNDLERVASMLQVRPDLVDMQWSYGDERRALHYAVMKNAPDMVRLLMQHGADARAGVHPHRDATTARTMAVERGLGKIVSIIDAEERRRFEKVSTSAAGTARPDRPNERARSGPRLDPAVASAIQRGDTAWLRQRHAERPLVNLPDWNSGGLLTFAAANNQRQVLELLLDFGFDPDERVRWSEGPDAAYSQGYPLWHCAATGKYAMAELLLQRGASANVHVDSSGSPVYAAYRHRQQAMVDLLKRYGGIVTPDIVGLYRETELARELLDGTTRLPEGTIPDGRSIPDYLLEFALSGGAADIVRMALERIDWLRDDRRWFWMLVRGVEVANVGARFETGDQDVDRRSYLVGFRYLVDRCDPNVIGGFGRTALHEVAANDDVTPLEASAFATILLDANARMDVRDELFQSTPLGWACRWGRSELVTLFLERGADHAESEAEPWARPRAWAEKMNRGAVLKVLRKFGG